MLVYRLCGGHCLRILDVGLVADLAVLPIIIISLALHFTLAPFCGVPRMLCVLRLLNVPLSTCIKRTLSRRFGLLLLLAINAAASKYKVFHPKPIIE